MLYIQHPPLEIPNHGLNLEKPKLLFPVKSSNCHYLQLLPLPLFLYCFGHCMLYFPCFSKHADHIQIQQELLLEQSPLVLCSLLFRPVPPPITAKPRYICFPCPQLLSNYKNVRQKPCVSEAAAQLSHPAESLHKFPFPAAEFEMLHGGFA